MTEIDIDYRPEHEGPAITNGRPLLTWGHHPIHGNGWTLWFLEDPESATSGVDDYFMPGDLTDVETAVRSAQQWLELRRAD